MQPSDPDPIDRPIIGGEDDEALSADPVWAGPPWHQCPGVTALSLEIGRSASTALTLEGARAYQEGVIMRLVIRVRETGPEARTRLFAHLNEAHGRGQVDARLDPQGLRWGVELSDGRRVTTLDESPGAAGVPDGEDSSSWLPEQPVREGLARPIAWGDMWSREIWLWPLPPPGLLRVTCAWPDRDVPETFTDVDAAPLRAAALRAESLWD